MPNYPLPYYKDINGVQEMFYADESGVEVQLTSNGKLMSMKNVVVVGSDPIVFRADSSAEVRYSNDCRWVDPSQTFYDLCMQSWPSVIRSLAHTPLTQTGDSADSPEDTIEDDDIPSSWVKSCMGPPANPDDETKVIKATCHCDFTELLRHGCKCGGA